MKNLAFAIFLLISAQTFSQDLFFAKGNLTNPVLPKITREQYFDFKFQFGFEASYSVKDGAPDKNFSTKTYLSYDTILSKDDLYMYEDDMSDIYVFGIVQLDCNSFINGNWYVLVQLDANNVVKETDETNNMGYFPIYIPILDCGQINKRLVTFGNQFQKGQLIDKFSYHIEIQSTSMAMMDSSQKKDVYYFDRNNVFVYLSKDLVLDNTDVYLNVVSPPNYPQLFVTQNERSPGGNLCQSVTNASSHAPVCQVKPNSDYLLNAFYPCNTSLQIPFNVQDGYYYFLFYSTNFAQNTPPPTIVPIGTSYEYFTSPRVLIGSLTTELDETSPLDEFNPILHYYDLSGSEVSVEKAMNRVVIASYANGTRKLIVTSPK